MLTSVNARSQSTDLFSSPQTESIASCLCRSLKEHQTPMSLHELETCLMARQRLSHRTLKETVWKLVEEGKIQFTSNWDLEIID